MGAVLFHADGRTDRHKEAKIRLSQSCERAQNLVSEPSVCVLLLLLLLFHCLSLCRKVFPSYLTVVVIIN